MFMRKGEPITPLLRTRHRIELTSDKVARVTPRKLLPAQRESVQDALKEILELKIVRPSKSPWAAQTVLVPKPDGTWPCCIDYRGLNAVTKRNAHPIPRTNDVLNVLSPAKYFTSVDMFIRDSGRCQWKKQTGKRQHS